MVLDQVNVDFVDVFEGVVLDDFPFTQFHFMDGIGDDVLDQTICPFTNVEVNVARRDKICVVVGCIDVVDERLIRHLCAVEDSAGLNSLSQNGYGRT